MKESRKGKFASKANNILSPNKVTGLADFLDDEAESKSANAFLRTDTKTDIQRDVKTESQTNGTTGIVRENFRLAEPLAERLRQYAFDKRTTKTDVVAQALEEFFTRNGY